jgi:hypothetical protein
VCGGGVDVKFQVSLNTLDVHLHVKIGRSENESNKHGKKGLVNEFLSPQV